jgi:hypothetical protein
MPRPRAHRALRRTLLSLTLGIGVAAPAAAQDEAPPRVPAATVLKATFQTSQGVIDDVGTGFLLESPDHGTVFVTALHVFGPPGGLSEWATGADLPALVESAALRDAFTHESAGRVVGVIPTPLASLPTTEGGQPGRDFAVFEIADFTGDGMEPESGEPTELWIVSPGLPDEVPLRVSRVDASPNFVSVAIPEDLSLPIGISGSPIVTSEGRAVALVVMLGEGPAGERVVHATPIRTVVEALGG